MSHRLRSVQRLTSCILAGLLLVTSPSLLGDPSREQGPPEGAETTRWLADFGPVLRNLIQSGVISDEEAVNLQDKSRRLEKLRKRPPRRTADAKPSDVGEDFLKESARFAEELDRVVAEFLDQLRSTADSGEIPDALAQQMTDRCRRALPRLVPFYRSRIEALAAKKSYDPSMMNRHKAAIDECSAYLDRALNHIERDLASLEDELEKLTEERDDLLEKLAAAGTEAEKQKIQEEIDELEVEIKEVKKKIQKKKKVKGKLDLGKILSGIVNIAIGAALVAFSSGAGAQLGWGLIAGGIALVIDGIDDATEEKTVTVDEPAKGSGEKTRLVEEKKKPGQGKISDAVEPYLKNGYTNISGGDEGNFHVLVSPEGDWLILQIDPRKTVLRIVQDAVDESENTRGVKFLSDLIEPQVVSIKNVSKAIELDFTARVNGSDERFNAGLTEIGTVTGRFLLSVDE